MMVVIWMLASIPATLAGIGLAVVGGNGVQGLLLGVAIWTVLVMVMSR